MPPDVVQLINLEFIDWLRTTINTGNVEGGIKHRKKPMPNIVEKPKMLVGTSVRVTKNNDQSGVTRQWVVVYGDNRGSEIWLRHDQSLTECLRKLGLSCDSIPEQCGDEEIIVSGRVYEDAFAKAKALFCSHTKTQEMAESYFAELSECLQKRADEHNTTAEPGKRLNLTRKKTFFRVTGRFICHGHLEQPKERAERKMHFTFHIGPQDVGPGKIIAPSPTFATTGRLVWSVDGKEVRPNAVAESIVKELTGRH